MAVEIRVRDAILTVLDKVVMPRAEVAVSSITESSERGPSSMVQDHDHKVENFGF